MPLRKFALYDRDKECTDHRPRWTGEIPNTGRFLCTLCGAEVESIDDFPFCARGHVEPREGCGFCHRRLERKHGLAPQKYVVKRG